MKKKIYRKGNCMTFPLELTGLNEEIYGRNNDYLYPVKVNEISKNIKDMCDKMEYDGSVMYDEYPDKVLIERMSERICEMSNCHQRKDISIEWMRALCQVMLCNEMSFRRDRRRYHKRNLGK